MINLQFLTGNEPPETVLTVIYSGLGIAGTIIFYLTMIKPKQDAKREAKRQRESNQAVGPDVADPDGNNRSDGEMYNNIVNDYPTCPRQDRVKKPEFPKDRIW